MRPRVRLAIAGFLGIGLSGALVALSATGASADTCAGWMRLFICGALMLSVIGALCREGDDRAWFVGFAAFGWGYFALAHWYSDHQGPVPTVAFVSGSGEFHSDLRSLGPIVRVAHDAWALAFGVLGMILAGLLARNASTREPEDAEGESESECRPDWWHRPAIVGILALVLAMTSALAGWRFEPRIAAGTAFLIAWCAMGLAVLGAAMARGRLRQAWFGAAGFGLGYLVLAFAPVSTAVLPTNHLLNAVLRPGGPATPADGTDDDLDNGTDSRRMRDALAQPVTLHYPASTSLGVVIDEVKRAIRWPLDKDLVLLALWDDLRLSSEQFLGLRVAIDRANIPAKDALRLCLKPLGYRYRIESGYIRILPDAYRPVPFEQDPVMIAGHSLLALISAAIGGVMAPFVAAFCRRRSLYR